MTCLGCQRLESADQCVTLANGTVVCTYCPAWLIECEARELLKLPKQTRIEALKKRELKRGDVTELKESMMMIFNKEKQHEKTSTSNFNDFTDVRKRNQQP